MKGKCLNIYKTSRLTAGITQEHAAELLYISTRSLADYETGRTVPPDDVVCRMIDTYGCKHLGYVHLKQNTKVGQRFLPDINLADLPSSVLRLQKEVGDLSDINRDMLDIACDGVVDEGEERRWMSVTKEIKEVAGAALAVSFVGG